MSETPKRSSWLRRYRWQVVAAVMFGLSVLYIISGVVFLAASYNDLVKNGGWMDVVFYSPLWWAADAFPWFAELLTPLFDLLVYLLPSR